MGLYIFKTVPATEKNKLISFIDNHWKKDHAIIKSEILLNFQHYNSNENQYNFIVAENKDTGEYDAIVGFIPVAQYDQALIKNGNYWGAIWKYREDIQNSEINNAAFYLWKLLFKLPYFQSYAAIGISEIARQIYKASRMNIGFLSQYYILNDKISNFKIAGNVTSEDLKSQKSIIENGYIAKWITLEDVSDSIQPAYKPQKTLSFFKERYGNHPIYKYRYIGVYKGDHIVYLLACRIVEANYAKCIRIIDVLGKIEGNIYNSLKEILYSEGAEYIDIMNYGIDKKVFLQMGFKELSLEEPLIIPNYFEPFKQCNIRINIAYKANFDGYVAFKGDSDQDRPNIIL